MAVKRIVMICNYFAPDNRIAAIRITKLAKYFKQHGYEVTVITEKKDELVEDELLKKDAEGICTIRVSNSKRMKKIVLAYENIIKPVRQHKFDNLDDRMRVNKNTGKAEFYPFPTAHPIIGSLDYLVELLRQYDLFWALKSHLKTLKTPMYLFTSYGDYFGVLAGRYLHKKYRKVPWIADFRDGIYQYKFTPGYVKWIARLFEKRVWREAECITAISKGLCQTVPQKYRKKVHCVTNGFDGKERENIAINNVGKNKLRFVYTGGMYGGMRSLAPIFWNIKKLADRKEIDLNKVEFCYAGKEAAYKIFVSQAQEYGIDSNCVYRGSVTRKEALNLQMEADILLVAALNTETEKGNLTGKALEYMGANKPIIAIVNGNVPNSELGEIIDNAKLGFTYEEANYKESNRALYQYLLEKYDEFIENGKLSHNPDEKILKKFDYQYLGNKMLRIIENINC